jgi:hypothetical protein
MDNLFTSTREFLVRIVLRSSIRGFRLGGPNATFSHRDAEYDGKAASEPMFAKTRLIIGAVTKMLGHNKLIIRRMQRDYKTITTDSSCQIL